MVDVTWAYYSSIGGQMTSSYAHARLRRQLQAQLLELDYRAFAYLVQNLLKAMGYAQVEVARSHWKGRKPRGGRDLDMLAQAGVTRARVLVQIKQYTRPVPNRFLDELRGAILRSGAQHGILITTSTFPPAVYEAAKATVTPIRLINGRQLSELLILYRIGVQESQDNEPLRINTELFKRLQVLFTPCPPSKQQKMCNNGAFSRCRIPVWSQESVETNRTGGHMTWRTHCLAGISSLWLLALIPGGITPATIGPACITAAVSALVPDFDAAESKLKHLRIAGIKPLAPIAVIFYRGLGHRGLLHSWLGWTIFSLVVALLSFPYSWQIALAASLGYGSHLIADAATRSGIPWLYPRPDRYHILPLGLRFITGSPGENVLLLTFVLWVGLLLLLVVATMTHQGVL